MNAYDIFNTKLREFADDLIEACPEVRGFVQMRTAIDISVALDRRMLQQYFSRYVKPYERHIQDEDEAFFLGHEYRGVSVDADIVQQVKAVWATLGPDSKRAIWNHFKLLLVLSNVCLKQE